MVCEAEPCLHRGELHGARQTWSISKEEIRKLCACLQGLERCKWQGKMPLCSRKPDLRLLAAVLRLARPGRVLPPKLHLCRPLQRGCNAQETFANSLKIQGSSEQGPDCRRNNAPEKMYRCLASLGTPLTVLVAGTDHKQATISAGVEVLSSSWN